MAEFIREGYGKRIGVSACRRVGVCKASSIPSRPPDHYSRVEKQSYFPGRPYAKTPTRRHASLRRDPIGPIVLRLGDRLLPITAPSTVISSFLGQRNCYSYIFRNTPDSSRG